MQDQTSLTIRRSQRVDSCSEKDQGNYGIGRFGRPSSELCFTWFSNAFPLEAPHALLHDIRSPPVLECQLYQTLIDIYFPTDCGNQSAHFAHLRIVAGLASKHPVLNHGLRTLALVQIGYARNDERLLQNSVKCYATALGSLAKAVTEAANVEDDTVLAAARLLIMCEFFENIKTASTGWIQHATGMQQLLLNRGPRSLKSKLSQLVFYAARHSSLGLSYLQRKANVFATPAWRAAGFKVPIDDPEKELYDSLIQIPSILERFDCLRLSTDPSRTDVASLLQMCMDLARTMTAWLDNWHHCLARHGKEPYRLHSISSFPTFAHLVRNTKLDAAYRFDHYMNGFPHMQYWLGMFQLRYYAMQLMELQYSKETMIVPRDSPTARELDSYARDICRCLPAFFEDEAGTNGHLCAFMPLLFITKYFASRGYGEWLQWAYDVRDRCFNKGLRPPPVVADIPTIRYPSEA